MRPNYLQEDLRPLIGLGTLNISAVARERVNHVLESNRLSYGPMTQSLESQFSKLHDCRFGVMSNSGTSALHIALAAMKELHEWRDGDEVIIPAVTFVATANIVFHNRMQPVPVDVDPVYYEIDPEKIEAAITDRTRAIIPVHLFGQPCDMDPIIEIAREHRLRIIEDSCETMFSNYKGKRVGSLGDIGCFSTYVAHLLTTGVGGLNTTNSPEYAVKIRSLMNHGRDSIYLNIDDDDGKSPEELSMIVSRRFSFVSMGHSFRVTEIEAALGLAQLENWEEMIQSRRRNAEYLRSVLLQYSDRLQLPETREACDHSFMMFPIVLLDKEKDEFVSFLERNRVETRDMLPLTNQPVFGGLKGFREDLHPVAKWVNSNGFYIGCHQDLKESDLDYVAELFGRYWRNQSSKSTLGATLVLIVQYNISILEKVLEEIPVELFDGVMAVDIGADQETVQKLESGGIRVLPSNGRDIVSVIQAESLELLGENLVFFPLDGRQDVRDIARLLLSLERDNDMVIASRFLQSGARYDRHRKFKYRSTGNRVFTLLANLCFYGNLSDSLSQLRGAKLSWLKEINIDSKGLSTAYQVSILALRRGLRIKEIPTVEDIDLTRRDFWQAWKSIGPLLIVLLKEWFRFRRESS